MLPSNKLLNSKPVSLLLMALTFGLIFIPFAKFPIKFMAITVIVLLITYLQNGNLRNLKFRKITIRSAITILFVYAVLEIVMDFVLQPLVSYIFDEPADYSAFDFLNGDAYNYFRYLIYMWISAAIGEEILFRAFMTLQLSKIIGDKKVIIAIITAVLFSLPHLYQGLSGLVMTFFFGLSFGYIYLKFNNIWINIIVHGLIDSLFLTLAYFGETDFYTSY